MSILNKKRNQSKWDKNEIKYNKIHKQQQKHNKTQKSESRMKRREEKNNRTRWTASIVDDRPNHINGKLQAAFSSIDIWGFIFLNWMNIMNDKSNQSIGNKWSATKIHSCQINTLPKHPNTQSFILAFTENYGKNREWKKKKT